MENVVIIGAGDFSKLVLDILIAQNKKKKQYNILGLIDENKKEGYDINGFKVLGDFTWFDNNKDMDFKVICSVAEPDIKKRLVEKAEKIGLKFFKAIHPDTSISESSEISNGVIINAGARIAANVKLEKHVTINFNSTIGHDVEAKKFSSVMPGANIAGFVKLKEGVYIGMNSAIIQDKIIGSYCKIGAGAVVVDNIPDNVTAVGIPAKKLNRT